MTRKILFIFCIMLASCSGGKLGDIQPGMTEKQVEEIMGKPTRADATSQHFDNPDGTSVTLTHAYWIYQGVGTVSFDNGKVAEVIQDTRE